MSLWPHQQRAISEIEAAIAFGDRRICVTSPTGGGKTRMMAELIQAHADEGVILYTNRKMLREQTSDVMEAAGIDHGVRAAGTKPALLRNVQVSSIQTEHSRVVKRKKWELHEAKLVLIDEAHNQKEETAREIMRRHLEQGSTVIGFTATPLDIGELYDHLIVAGTNSELRECGAHVPAQTYGPDEPDLRHIKKYQVGDDLSQGDNVNAMMRPGIFGRVFEWWKRLNPEAQPALLFAPGVKESVWFAEEFRKMGVRAAHIDGDNVWIDGETIPSDREAREQVLSESRSGNIKIICNRFVMREGIDAPWLYHGIFATVFGSLTSFLQSGGRLLRAYPGLDHVVIQDHGGNWHRHGSLNADREWELSLTNRIACGEFQERCREENAAKSETKSEGIACAKCSRIRSSGHSCPYCGHVSPLRTRAVVQIDGSLKPQEGDVHKQRVIRQAPDTERIWRSTYMRAKNSRNEMTFRQAVGLFFYENHYYPPRDLPFMPIESRDWYANVKDVPASKLTGFHERANT